MPGSERIPYPRTLYTTNFDRFPKNIKFSEREILKYKRTKRLKHVEHFCFTLGISFHRNLTQNCMLRDLEHGILPINLQTSMERQVEVWAQSDAIVWLCTQRTHADRATNSKHHRAKLTNFNSQEKSKENHHLLNFSYWRSQHIQQFLSRSGKDPLPWNE